MIRSFTYSALVLRARPAGESNREVTFLTAEEGIIRATVFGGPKSKLRSHTQTGHSGILWIYRDPAKDFLKVTDFDVRLWRPGIRESYGRTMAAAAVAETILTSHGGGGSWTEALALADRTLDALELAEESAVRRVVLHFFWNWAEILGARPDLSRCGSCACEVPPDGLLWYSKQDGLPLCPNCAEIDPLSAPGFRGQIPGGYLPIGPGSRRWLAAAGGLGPEAVFRYTMDSVSEGEAKALVTAILEDSLGKRLSTWDTI
jgi:DNA repair protein RecO (recombination protein O)